MVLGECGRLPLAVTYHTNCIKYWCKLIQMQESRYPKHCYKMLKSLDDIGRVTWATQIKHLLYRYGFGIVWFTHNIGNTNLFISQLEQRLKDCLRQNWHSSITSMSRCDLYKQMKITFKTRKIPKYKNQVLTM